MNLLTLNRRGFAPLAAILVLAATATVAEARMGGGMGGAIAAGHMHGPTTMPGNNPTMGHTDSKHYSWRFPWCPYNSDSICRFWRPIKTGGGGTTGGFAPGGGSGTKPKGKPNLQ